MTNVLETPRIAEMLRKVRDKYVPITDAYARAFLSQLAARIIRAEAERPCFDSEAAYRYAIEQALHLLELGRDFDVSHAKVWLKNAIAGCVELPDHIAEPHGVPQCGATTRKGTICGQPARYEVGEPGDDPMPVCSEHQTRAATMGWPNRRIERD